MSTPHARTPSPRSAFRRGGLRICRWAAFVTAAALLFGLYLPLSAPPAAAAAGYLQLETLTPVSTSYTYDRYRVNEAPDNRGALKLKDPDGQTVTYAHGFAAHANSEVIFDIAGFRATRFTALYGVNDPDRAANNGRVQFFLYADDTLLLDSSTLGVGYLTDRDVRGAADVAIPEGARTLRLLTRGVAEGGNLISHAHGIWVEPRLYVDDTDRILVSLSLPTTLETGGTAHAVPRFSTLAGAPVDAAPSAQWFSSSNETAVTVSETGVLTAHAAGEAVIRYRAVINGLEAEAEAALRVIKYAESWALDAPDGHSGVRARLDDRGVLSYYITREDEVVVEPSSIGFKTSLEDFSNGLLFLSREDRVIDETYDVFSGKASSYVNRAREMTLRFAKGDARFDVIFRAYDDGAAFRYRIARADGTEVNITLTDETSAFTAPAGSGVFAMPNGSGNFCHEGTYAQTPIESLNGKQTLPLLYETPGGAWVLLSEADLITQPYCGSVLDASAGSTTMELGLPQQQSTAPTARTPFQSPWRFAVTGPLKHVVENTMAENLSPAPDPKYRFEEWVKPGVSVWTWMVGGAGIQSNQTEIRRYIDLAAEMGWRYFILDEGWQSAGRGNYDGRYPANFKENVLDYAKEKGVGILVWVHVTDLDSEAERLAHLTQWARDGIVGIKADFFDRESQDRMQLYSDLYALCAELRLILNCHGANKPTGEIRTFPNALNREGVRGEEFNGNSKAQDTILPFTRGAVGPTDFTPRIYPVSGSNITTSQQLALNVLLESGIPCMADNAANYRRTPAYSFLKNLPSAWDETLFLGGRPNEYAAVARRRGGSWYAGAANNNGQRTVTFALDFLEEGVTYRAEIFKDRVGGGKNDMDVETRSVIKGDVIDVVMVDGGGCALKLIRPTTFESLSLPGAVMVAQFDTYRFVPVTVPALYDPSDLLWSSSDPAVASVSGDGYVTAHAPGLAVITARAAVGGAQAVSTVRVTLQLGHAPTDGWYVLRPLAGGPDYNTSTSLTITTSMGDFGPSDMANNMVLRPPADADFDISVKVTGVPVVNYQSFALVVRSAADPTRIVAAIKRYHSGLTVDSSPNIYQLFSYAGGYNERQVKGSSDDTTSYLRLVKSGSQFTAYYKVDAADDWRQISTLANTAFNGLAAEALEIGVMATNSNTSSSSANPAIRVTFEDFTYNGVVLPFTSFVEDYVLAAEPAADLSVGQGTPADALGLPAAIPVLLAGGGDDVYPVTWVSSGYNPDVPGQYLFEGTLDDTDKPVKNAKGVKARLTVTVRAAVLSVDVETRETGDGLTVTASIANGTPASASLYLLLALYDEAGRLVSCDARDATVGAHASGSATFAVDGETLSAHSVKLFVWDTEYRPLTDGHAIP